MNKRKLNNLYTNLFINDEELKSLLDFYYLCPGDVEKKLEDIYARDFAPVRVSKLNSDPRACISEEDLFINYSYGYDLFLKTFHNEINRIVSKRVEALNMLYCITRLNSYYSKLLLMRYYERKSIDQILEELYISHSTYYRTLRKAVSELESVMNEHNDRLNSIKDTDVDF